MEFQEPKSYQPGYELDVNTARIFAYVAQLLTAPEVHQGVKLLLDAVAGRRWSTYGPRDDASYGGDSDPGHDMDSIRYNVQQVAYNSGATSTHLEDISASLRNISVAVQNTQFGDADSKRSTLPELERAVSEARRIGLDQAEAREELLKKLHVEAVALLHRKHALLVELSAYVRSTSVNNQVSAPIILSKLQAIVEAE